MGNEKTLRHPRDVDTTLVVVVTVADDVLTTSDFSTDCVLVKAKTFLGARSTGVRTTVAPETGHFSSCCPSDSLEELSQEEVCSKPNSSELERERTVGVELSERSRCVCFPPSTLSSDAMSAVRTSGLRDSHMSVTDLGILPMYSSLLFDKESTC